MRKFTTHLLTFILVLLTILAAFLLLQRYCGNFKVNENSSILIVGHSHPECAFNDSLIGGVKNYAASGESYFYTYFKTKKIIEENPEMTTVLIEFSNNQIRVAKDDWIWNEEYILNRLPKYGAYMDFEAYRLLFTKNPKGLMNAMPGLFKYSLNQAFGGYKIQEDIGGYLYLERNKTDSLVASINQNPDPENSSNAISAYNLKYLQKLIDYLTSLNKRVFLIRSPLHDLYEGYSNEEQFQELRKTDFSGIEFLDFSKFALENSEFGDLEHLNYKGARKFSLWFNQLLLEGLLEKNEKQDFINASIELAKKQSDI